MVQRSSVDCRLSVASGQRLSPFTGDFGRHGAAEGDAIRLLRGDLLRHYLVGFLVLMIGVIAPFTWYL